MTGHADFKRLNRALDDALVALPHAACSEQPPAVRRQCREVVLLLLQIRERVQRLAEAFPSGCKGA